MFPLFSFIVLFLSYVTAVCFLSRFPTLFRQISLTLTLFFPNSFAFLSLFLFLMSLLSYCLSFVHCISSILSDFVCFICRSLSFLPQFFNFFALSVVLSLTYVTAGYLSFAVFPSLSYVIAVLLPFVRPLYFVNSPRLLFAFSVVLCLSFVFLNRSFPFLRHCCLIVFRSSTVFRQFSPTSFAFSVVLCLSFVFLNRSFPFLRHCCVFPLSVSHSVSSTLSGLDSFLPAFNCLPVVVSLSYVSPFLSLSFSVVNSVTYVFAVLLSFARPLYFVNSLRLCFLSLSFLSILRQFFNFFVFLNRSFSYLRHCCIFVFRCRSFTFLRHCCLIVFRSSTVFRQFSTTLFTFLCRSFSFSC